ncbi:LytR/AlgR family response regulator transcription factor [Dyadobacter psychrophilus]|uniref:Two component transcriptional regulator, LytTR family n=1 Tax=Dyadobacter psychrophilus TaxID=651661 RepID=A0A1T5HFB4_9BACT|nr:LytTR family DNA-binding domain-containing protein [Dyadobacter psychrophilus]SKC19352.1 two component transcriptional regulator, LytTR family [Dyadobacter psychrophilus]
MKCIAIDDEPLALDVLRNYISKIVSLDLVQTFDDALAGADFLQNNNIDLLFIDINMPDMSGLELVSRLENKPMVIFTTAHKKFAHEGFELEALDYLLKPIGFERFEKAVNKAVERYQFLRSASVHVSDFIVVRSKYKVVKIGLDDIEFIESMEDYIKIHLLSSRHPVLTLMSLKGILEILPQSRFSRIHRSYIVPDAFVKSIQNKKVKLVSGKELPISDSYLDFILSWKNR